MKRVRNGLTNKQTELRAVVVFLLLSMSITWRLAAEIPAKYIRQTNKLIVS